jgi:ABC-type transporter Mla subunit MlaD
MSDADVEQLRRLKNTVMGAANRLSILARRFPPEQAGALDEAARTLSAAAQDLNRLLARIRR